MPTTKLQCRTCAGWLEVPEFESLAEAFVECPTCRTSYNLADQETRGSLGQPTLPAKFPLVEVPGFEVHELLGQGGMALVYRATQKSLNRQVALKVLRPEFAQHQEFARRFLREGLTIASLERHPHVVEVFDQQMVAGQSVLVMEYVEGPDQRPLNLKELIARTRLSVDQCADLTDQIASALEFVHAKRIWHRDVKPQNVLIDRSGRAKLSDFGIAAVEFGEGTHLTSTSLGTIDYMSPEQARSPAEVDQRTDVYSLGVVLYEMLTGRLPSVVTGLPSQVVRDLSAGWDDLVRRALDRDVQQRLGSITEFRKLLEVLRHAHAAPPMENAPCPNCEQTAPAGAKFCRHCGLVLRPECPACGEIAAALDKFCGSCGTPLAKPTLPAAASAKTPPILLKPVGDKNTPPNIVPTRSSRQVSSISAVSPIFPDVDETVRGALLTSVKHLSYFVLGCLLLAAAAWAMITQPTDSDSSSFPAPVPAIPSDSNNGSFPALPYPPNANRFR